MTLIVLAALAISIVLYIVIGFLHNKHIKDLADIIPLFKGKMAKVKRHEELSASNVAASISLATVIVAFFDLVPGLGLWLMWPAITTAIGFWFFSILSRRIWNRMSVYPHRPTMHEFLGTEFSSKKVAFIAALFTTIGYLSAFAVELTVGSRFLAGLIPEIPEWITVLLIASAGLIYTAVGGFRTVIVTDRIQMGFIWLLLFSLLLFYLIYSISNGGIVSSIQAIPENVRTISWSNSLIPFVAGIFIMNLFTYISNMGLWQRISATQDPSTIVKGMSKTVWHSAISWTLFALIAVGAFIVVTPIEGENFLITLLKSISSTLLGKTVIFCVAIGLYGAMLSTASTQLIVISHTVYEDILAPLRKKKLADRVLLKKEMGLSRLILTASAIAAIVIVEILRVGGFSVADLAFAIYGAALGLVPPIFYSLYLKKEKLKFLGVWATLAVVSGFVSSWIASIYGKVNGDGNLVFWAPVISLGVSSFIMVCGHVVCKVKGEGELPSVANHS